VIEALGKSNGDESNATIALLASSLSSPKWENPFIPIQISYAHTLLQFIFLVYIKCKKKESHAISFLTMIIYLNKL
jgi:hypothetical protein